MVFTSRVSRSFGLGLLAVLVVSLVFSSCAVVKVEAQTASDLGLGVIRILSNGDVEGTDKIQRNGNTYTLTSDISIELNNSLGQERKTCILIMKDNIILDGAGHTISCNGTGLGIYFRGVQGVTIENFKIRGFLIGISSYVMDPIAPIELLYKTTANNLIRNNDIEVVESQNSVLSPGSWGIFVEFSEDVTVRSNIVKCPDSAKGMYVGSTCNRTIVADNQFIGCGLDLYTLNQTTLDGNTLDGHPVISLRNQADQVVSQGEQVFIYNCQNVNVTGIQPHNQYRRTIQMEASTGCTVTNSHGVIALKNSDNNDVYGNPAQDIFLYHSNYNRVYGNDLSGGYLIFPRAAGEEGNGRCIDLFGSKYNSIYNNSVSDSVEGIHLGEPEGVSTENRIYQNSIRNVSTAILALYSPSNYFYSNKISNSSVGVRLSVSNDEIVVQNNITGCNLAYYVMGSNNQFYHNNLVDNIAQVRVENQMLFTSDIVVAYSVNNTFDIGYPAGGNYWSSFVGIDQNSDGISDTPYVVYGNNTDFYPLMAPVNAADFAPPAFPDPTPTPTPTPSSTSPTQTPTATQTTQGSQSTATTTIPELTTTFIVSLIAVTTLFLVAVKLNERQSAKANSRGNRKQI